MQQKHFLIVISFAVFVLCNDALFSSKKDTPDKSQEPQDKCKDVQFLLTLDEELFLEELERMGKKEEAEKKKCVLQEKKLSKSFKNFQEKIGKQGGTFGSFSLPAMKKNNKQVEKKFSLDSVYAYDPKGSSSDNQDHEKKCKFIRKFSASLEEKDSSHEPSSSSGKQANSQSQNGPFLSVSDNQQLVFFEEDLNELFKTVLKK